MYETRTHPHICIYIYICFNNFCSEQSLDLPQLTAAPWVDDDPRRLDPSYDA